MTDKRTERKQTDRQTQVKDRQIQGKTQDRHKLKTSYELGHQGQDETSLVWHNARQVRLTQVETGQT